MRVFGRDVSRNRLSLWRALLAVGAMALFGGARALAETLPRAGELERVSDRFLERYDTGGAAGTPAAAPAELPESRVVALLRRSADGRHDPRHEEPGGGGAKAREAVARRTGRSGTGRFWAHSTSSRSSRRQEVGPTTSIAPGRTPR